jgi:acetyl esterase/lipase
MKHGIALLLLLVALAPSPVRAEGSAVTIVKDIPYLAGAQYSAGKDKLDLYLPEGRTNVPVIVSYYGGGLTAGDKDAQAFVGQRFAAAGIATAVVNYRLTPEVQHPGHIQDAAASFAWVKRHIAEYGGDPAQVFVIGHSAGAYLVALLATDERYVKAQKLSLQDIRGVVPVSAFYWVEKKGVAPDRDKRIWGTDEKAWIDASPAHHLGAGVPPMLVLYADGDDAWRRDQNVEAARALTDAGARDVAIVMIGGRTHNTIWNRMAEASDETAERIVAFVRGHAAVQRSQQR